MGRGGHYLLTWTTYGTWLPGDSRGFVSEFRRGDGQWVIQNGVGAPYRRDEPAAYERARKRMAGSELFLTPAAAEVVRDALLDVERTHDLVISVGAIMRGHVHVVVASRDREGADLLRLFKGVASRRLGQRIGRAPVRWWTDGGSHPLLPTRDAVARASRYVAGQENVLVYIRIPSEPATSVADANVQVRKIPPPSSIPAEPSEPATSVADANVQVRRIPPPPSNPAEPPAPATSVADANVQGRKIPPPSSIPTEPPAPATSVADATCKGLRMPGRRADAGDTPNPR